MSVGSSVGATAPAAADSRARVTRPTSQLALVRSINLSLATATAMTGSRSLRLIAVGLAASLGDVLGEAGSAGDIAALAADDECAANLSPEVAQRACASAARERLRHPRSQVVTGFPASQPSPILVH